MCFHGEAGFVGQREQLATYGVDAERIYFDHGRSGCNTQRPALSQAIATFYAGDTLVVTKLDRLARSVHDASAIAQDLQQRGVTLQIGSDVYNPDNPTGRLLFKVLAMIVEFEAGLIFARTREGMANAKKIGKLRGKQPKLSPRQQQHVREIYASGEFTQADIAELMNVSDRTVRRIVKAALS